MKRDEGELSMSILRLRPSGKDYLWGGRRLIDDWGYQTDGSVMAEAWELSTHPDGPSFVCGGDFDGQTFADYLATKGRSVLGTNCRRFDDFPILIKLIDAKQKLSIQVHPDDEYAGRTAGQFGKTEMWYVLDAEEGAFIYYGFKEEISEAEFEQLIRDNRLTEALQAVSVKTGDAFFIEAGTIHAIGEGILIAEIQQNSNLTYRVFDYGRLGADGQPRKLHIEQALAVTRREPAENHCLRKGGIADCDLFTVALLELNKKSQALKRLYVGEDSFLSILVLDGEGRLCLGAQEQPFMKGDSFFIEAGSGEMLLQGQGRFVLTSIREELPSVRVGIDIGGTDVKIGLVSPSMKLIGEGIIATLSDSSPEELADRITAEVQTLLAEHHIPMEKVEKVGVGVPGMVDRTSGTVIYSNNIPWVDVPLASLLEARLGRPVVIANDADCAALGEVLCGPSGSYQNGLMITLGTGVGSGVILNGELFGGALRGGCECGHIVIHANGEPCTCGRRGCFEAYASATALIREGRKALAAEPNGSIGRLCGGDAEKITAKLVFDAADAKDPAAVRIVEKYISDLGIGLVNLVNIFRPEVVLLGGGVSRQGERLLAPLRKILQKDCFGGQYGECPRVAVAVLGNSAGVLGAACL